MKRKCGNCRYFREGQVTHCRAHPPRALDTEQSAYPPVRPDWDCGEHRYSLRRLVKALTRRKPKEGAVP